MNPSDGVQILKSSKQKLKNTINVDKEFAQRNPVNKNSKILLTLIKNLHKDIILKVWNFLFKKKSMQK